jgi:hypothetical protein
MQATQNISETTASAKSSKTKAYEFASESIPDTLAAIHVNPDTGLMHADVDVRRKEHGYNEVAGKKGAPGSEIHSKILGNIGMDARIDHGFVGCPRKIF